MPAVAAFRAVVLVEVHEVEVGLCAELDKVQNSHVAGITLDDPRAELVVVVARMTFWRNGFWGIHLRMEH